MKTKTTKQLTVWTKDKNVLMNMEYFKYNHKYISSEINRWIENINLSAKEINECINTLNNNQMEVAKQVENYLGDGRAQFSSKKEANKTKVRVLVEAMLQPNFKWAIYNDLKEIDKKAVENYDNEYEISKVSQTIYNPITGEWQTKEVDYKRVR